MEHKCKECGLREPKVRFSHRTVRGHRYKKHLCTKCAFTYNRRFSESDSASNKRKFRLRNWARLRRQKPENLAKVVLEDCRKSDRKKGRSCDLTISTVNCLLSKECIYCGDVSTRMTLDRIDNGLGHLQSNVNPACIRCNYIRGNMPYEAWLEIAPSIRTAREKGLFGSWSGKTTKRPLSSVG